jgi:hypothetical protein
MRSTDVRRRCTGLTLPARAARAARGREGLTIVEVMVALSVVLVAASIFCQMLISTARMRQVNRENALAADGARVVLERMRNLPFLDVYRAYNEDSKDDPGGIGTGPGHLFDVPGLQAIDGAPQGKLGRVFFPSMQVQVTTSGGGGKLGGLGPSTTTMQWHLREDVTDTALGMPRDLNGNNVVDTADHSLDYLVLPVRVLLEWKHRTGTRKFEIVTELGDFRREEAP